MKKCYMMLFVIATVCFVSSCSFPTSPIVGSIYTQVQAPLMATSNPVATKVGTAEATSVIGITTGDASIQEAAQKAGITRISHIDYESFHILGIYARFTVYVYGE